MIKLVSRKKYAEEKSKVTCSIYTVRVALPRAGNNIQGDNGGLTGHVCTQNLFITHK